MYNRVKVSHVRAASYLLSDFTWKAVSCCINASVTESTMRIKLYEPTAGSAAGVLCVSYISDCYDNPIKLLFLLWEGKVHFTLHTD